MGKSTFPSGSVPFRSSSSNLKDGPGTAGEKSVPPSILKKKNFPQPSQQTSSLGTGITSAPVRSSLDSASRKNLSESVEKIGGRTGAFGTPGEDDFYLLPDLGTNEPCSTLLKQKPRSPQLPARGRENTGIHSTISSSGEDFGSRMIPTGNSRTTSWKDNSLQSDISVNLDRTNSRNLDENICGNYDGASHGNFDRTALGNFDQNPQSCFTTSGEFTDTDPEQSLRFKVPGRDHDKVLQTLRPVPEPELNTLEPLAKPQPQTMQSLPKSQLRTMERLPKPQLRTLEPLPKPHLRTSEPLPKPQSHTLQPQPKPQLRTLQPQPKPQLRSLEPLPIPEPRTLQPLPKPQLQTLQPLLKPQLRTLEPLPIPQLRTMERLPKPQLRTLEPLPKPQLRTLEPLPKHQLRTLPSLPKTQLQQVTGKKGITEKVISVFDISLDEIENEYNEPEPSPEIQENPTNHAGDKLIPPGLNR